MASPQHQQESETEPSKSPLWNELPQEILGLMLSYLGKHDLLNARMVSHVWNEESLKVLRKSKFTQMLKELKIKEYILFTTPNGPRPLIIPFHLNIHINLISSWALCLKSLTVHVKSLYKMFGPQCVPILTLTNDNIFTEENIKEIGLIEFLELISEGLTTLDLSKFNSGIDFLKNQNQILTYPKLKKLICNTSECKAGRSGPGPAYISVIENSPNLEDLTLTHPCDLESWPINFNQLKSLTLDSLLNLQNVLDKILTSSGPPVLRELNVRDDVTWSGSLEDRLVVENILKSVSSTLKSLRYREPLFAQNPLNPRFISCQMLAHLEHLGLEYNIGNKLWINVHPEGPNASTQWTFPTLKSIEVPFDLISVPAYVPSNLEGDVTKMMELPNVIKLCIRVSATVGVVDLNGTFQYLPRSFPALSKLSLVNIGGNDCVKYFLYRFIKSEWSKSIREFEMIGFQQNYLGEVLNELEISPRVVLENCNGIWEEKTKKEFKETMKRMGIKCEETVVAPGSITLTTSSQSDSIKMTNLTRIKLELTDDFNSNTSQFVSTTATIPNLTSFGKYFPRLRMIEISELLFHQTDKSVRGRHILEFKSQFPDIVLNVT